jgi:hypothetical protein
LPAFADYAVGMPKTRLHKPDDRKSKTIANDAVAQDDQSTLPPKKPPAPSAKHRLKRGRKAKLLK